jgi:hypothetical protein
VAVTDPLLHRRPPTGHAGYRVFDELDGVVVFEGADFDGYRAEEGGRPGGGELVEVVDAAEDHGEVFAVLHDAAQQVEDAGVESAAIDLFLEFLVFVEAQQDVACADDGLGLVEPGAEPDVGFAGQTVGAGRYQVEGFALVAGLFDDGGGEPGEEGGGVLGAAQAGLEVDENRDGGGAETGGELFEDGGFVFGETGGPWFSVNCQARRRP